MKRILKFLARLYPSDWRKRYGVEYEALLEDKAPRVGDVFDVFWGALKMQMTAWSFVRIVLPCSVGGVIVAVAISFAIPAHYVSQTIVMAILPLNDGVCGNQNNLPAALRGAKPGFCVEEAIFDRSRKFLKEEGFSREFLASVIHRESLYERERGRMPFDAVIDEMQRNIHVSSSEKEGQGLHFAIQFYYPDPRVAQLVDNELVSYVEGKVRDELTREFIRGLSHVGGGAMLSGPLKETGSLRERMLSGASSELEIHSESDETFPALNVASLPERSSGLSRIQLGMVGLLAGFLFGLVLAPAGKV